MKKEISVSDLERWKKNYTNPANKSLDVETESIAISLDVLQAFIRQAKKNSPGFSGVRVYFIRYDDTHDNLRANTRYVKEIGDSGFSQVSLAFVPVNNFEPLTLKGKDLKIDNKILTLAICHPTDWQKEPLAGTGIGTGLCPPKCKA